MTTQNPTAEQNLLSSLENMHCMANGSLARIRGIAKCALRALETDSGARDLAAIADVLKAIVTDTDVTYNVVACMAEEHGIQTVEKDWTNRLNAMCRAHATPTDAEGA